MSIQKENIDFNFAPLNENEDQISHVTGVSSNIDTRSTVLKIMGLVSRLTMVLIISHVVYLSFDQIRLFSLHPACMAMGYLLFMMEAIVSLSQDTLPILRNIRKTTAHWILQVIASSLIAIGFLAIVINKYKKDSPHFVSWHGYMGLIAACCVLGTNFGGTAALYSINLKSYIRPSLMKAIHSLFGIVTFCLGLITLVLGFYTKWFVRNANEGYSFFYSVLIMIIGLRALIVPLKNVFARLKSN